MAEKDFHLWRRRKTGTPPAAVLAAAVCLCLWTFASPLFAAEGGHAGEDRRFLAGASTSNITPMIGSRIYGGFTPPPSRHVHDELYARTLVLDDGETRLAFVVCDNVAILRSVFDEARRLVAEKTEIPPDNIMMSASHTHSGPNARGENRFAVGVPLDEYQNFLAGRIADGVVRAVNNLEPARIGWGVASEPGQVFNRRWFLKPGVPIPNPFGGEDKVRMNPGVGNPDLLEPAGPVDPEIVFLSVQALDGRPIGLLANYSLHYVGGTGPREVSADYFGMFAERIRFLLGAEHRSPPFVGILSNGTSGDINNIDFRGEREAMPPYKRMRMVADVVAAEIYRSHRTIRFHDWVPLGAAHTELKLRSRRPTAEKLEWARKIMARPEDASPSAHPRERDYAERVLDIERLYPPEVSLFLQAFRIGELGVTAIPAEVFVEIGLELKERSPFQETFTVSLANGWHGYLPTVRHHELGGYETWLGTNLLEVEAAPKIVDSLLDLLESLR